MNITVYLDSPTESEIKEFESNSSVKISSLVLEEVLFFSIKIGEMPWMDAPYDPYHNENLAENLQALAKNEGYELTISLMDSSRGLILGSRNIALPHLFSVDLKDKISQLKASRTKSGTV